MRPPGIRLSLLFLCLYHLAYHACPASECGTTRVWPAGCDIVGWWPKWFVDTREWLSDGDPWMVDATLWHCSALEFATWSVVRDMPTCQPFCLCRPEFSNSCVGFQLSTPAYALTWSWLSLVVCGTVATSLRLTFLFMNNCRFLTDLKFCNKNKFSWWKTWPWFLH
jgi:hypothetical protein